MPLVKRLIRIGESTGLILDPAILQQVDIEPDSEVEVSVEGGAIVIRSPRHASDAETHAAGLKVVRDRQRLLDRLSKGGSS